MQSSFMSTGGIYCNDSLLLELYRGIPNKKNISTVTLCYSLCSTKNDLKECCMTYHPAASPGTAICEY